MPRIKTSDDTAGAVAGEIHGEPTIKTVVAPDDAEAALGGDAEVTPGGDGEGRTDKVANRRGMPPISRP